VSRARVVRASLVVVVFLRRGPVVVSERRRHRGGDVGLARGVPSALFFARVFDASSDVSARGSARGEFSRHLGM